MNKEKLKVQLEIIKEVDPNANLSVLAMCYILEALLEEDKEEVKVKEKPQHKPTEDDLGWTIYGDVYRATGENDLEEAMLSYENNNWFATKELAEKERAKRQAIVRVKDYIAENFGVFEPDWGDDEQDKYTFYFRYNYNKLDYKFLYSAKHYSPIGYIKSYEDCEELIKDCKEDLEIIYK